MLTADQAAQLKEVLMSEKRRLLQKAQEGLSFSMNRDRNAVGRDSIDESMEEELFSTELRLRDREKWLLGKINSALDRVEQNTVDECEDCGELIGFKRLLARPVTTLCIDCKEQQEQEETNLAQAKGPGAGTGLGGGAGETDMEEGSTAEE
jgi:DnaK suppressor protein